MAGDSLLILSLRRHRVLRVRVETGRRELIYFSKYPIESRLYWSGEVLYFVDAHGTMFAMDVDSSGAVVSYWLPESVPRSFHVGEYLVYVDGRRKVVICEKPRRPL